MDDDAVRLGQVFLISRGGSWLGRVVKIGRKNAQVEYLSGIPHPCHIEKQVPGARWNEGPYLIGLDRLTLRLGGETVDA